MTNNEYKKTILSQDVANGLISENFIIYRTHKLKQVYELFKFIIHVVSGSAKKPSFWPRIKIGTDKVLRLLNNGLSSFGPSGGFSLSWSMWVFYPRLIG